MPNKIFDAEEQGIMECQLAELSSSSSDVERQKSSTMQNIKVEPDISDIDKNNVLDGISKGQLSSDSVIDTEINSVVYITSNTHYCFVETNDNASEIFEEEIIIKDELVDDELPDNELIEDSTVSNENIDAYWLPESVISISEMKTEFNADEIADEQNIKNEGNVSENLETEPNELSSQHDQIHSERFVNPFSGNDTAIENIKTDSDKSASKSQLFYCNICGEKFDDQYHYRLHGREEGYDILSCAVCGSSFANRREDPKTHAFSSKFADKCTCGKAFSSKWALSRHVQCFSTGEKVQCKFCPMKFYLKKTLMRHEASHVSSNEFRCTQCSAIHSEHERRKLTHMAPKIPGKLHSCTLCTATFKQKYKLLDHLRKIHEGRAFKCDICLKVISCQESTRAAHMRLHRKSAYQQYFKKLQNT